MVEEGAYSNLTLAAELRRSRLPVRDRHLATELAYGTLRRMIRLDAAIASAATRPLARIDAETLSALRLGTYQLLFMRVPAHAAVAETVSLVAVSKRGFVNGVLRKISATPPPEAMGDTPDAVAQRTGLSAWAVAELRRLLPEDEVEPAAAAFAAPAPLSIRVNTCRADVDEVRGSLRKQGVTAEPGAHSPQVLRVAGADPRTLEVHRRGLVSVQDEASVLVAAAVGAGAGERILDVCAGPGGKATALGCDVGPGGIVVGADVSVTRARLVREAAGQAGVRVLVVAQDARRPAITGGFDAVLVDAPCSGLGAARRRPELLWRVPKEDLARLARLQVAILRGAASSVRPGGRLVYSVCTFPRAETDAAVRAFLTKEPAFEPAEVAGPGGPAPSHRLWPHVDGTDGMFYAGFRRA